MRCFDPESYSIGWSPQGMELWGPYKWPNIHPTGPMGLVYLPIHWVYFFLFHVGKYTSSSHGSYGHGFFRVISVVTSGVISLLLITCFWAHLVRCWFQRVFWFFTATRTGGMKQVDVCQLLPDLTWIPQRSRFQARKGHHNWVRSRGHHLKNLVRIV